MNVRYMEAIMEFIPYLENTIQSTGLSYIELLGISFLCLITLVVSAREFILWFFNIRALQSEIKSLKLEVNSLSEWIIKNSHMEKTEPYLKRAENQNSKVRDFHLSH